MNTMLLCLIASVLIMPQANTEAQKDASDDCSKDSVQKCSEGVYFYAGRDAVFADDKEGHKKFCSQQMSANECILSFADKCLSGKHRELMKASARGAQYYAFQLCHPNADPEHSQRFLALSECHKNILPSLNQCLHEVNVNLSAVHTENRVIVLKRFCCAPLQVSNCLAKASEACGPGAKQHFSTMSYYFTGMMTNIVCTDSPYFEPTSEQCQDLPPVKKTAESEPKSSLFERYVEVGAMLVGP